MSETRQTLRIGELSPSRWQRIRTVLDAVLDLPLDGRAAYLDEACAGAPELRADVESLIEADANAGDFLANSPRPLTLDAPEPPFTWGRLSVIETLGKGSYGTVYRAHDPVLQRDVALKVWHQLAARPEELDRMVWEARRLARVRHPNILVVHGVDEHDGRAGLWTELIDGTTLEAHLDSAGPLSAAEAAEVGVKVCDALAALHSAGLVHRDVKTTNVMRDRSGRLVLVDFGTVRELTGAGVLASHEPPLGTPAAMAPEQLSGTRVGPEVDVYGVGVLLYRLVTQHFPIEADSVAELTRRHAAGEAVPVAERRPDLSPGFVAVIDRALATDPATRFPDTGALQQALARLPEASSVSTAPPPDAIESPASRMLPRSLTRFVGREAPLDACTRHLRESRLLTLTGPGGSGKTRLGLELAERQAGRFGDGAWFVDLGLVRPGESTLDGIAAALGVRPGPGREVAELLEAQLGGIHALLVLDNCEHVRDDLAIRVGRLLDTCPDLTVLATSRMPLGLAAERVYAVPSLELPESGGSTEAIAQSEAVQLFVERASLVRFGFELDDAAARDVAEICRRLEGIPLAIELAASNARLLTPREMLERLGDRFRMLSQPARAVTARHNTLDAAIQWSYDLLDPEEQALLPGLAIFEGGWTGSAVAAVCVPHGGAFTSLERVGRLVDASLIMVESSGQSGTRYRMLETVRAFALGLLEKSGGHEDLVRRHIAYFRAMALESERAFWGPRQAEWLMRLDEDHPNLVAATRAATTRPSELESGLALAGALYRYWYSRGLVRLGRSLLGELLAQPTDRPDSEARLRALYASAGLAVFEGDVAFARAQFEQGLARSESLGPTKVARWRIGLSSVAQRVGDFSEARAQLLHSLAVYREAGDDSSQIVVLHNLAETELCEGRLREARAREYETLEQARRTGNVLFEAVARVLLGSIAARLGETATAREYLSAARPGVRSIRAKILGVELIEAACVLGLAEGDVPRVVRWLAVAAHERETAGLVASPAQQRALAALRYDLDARLANTDDLGSGASPAAAAPAERSAPAGPIRIDYATALDEVDRWLDEA